MLLHNSKRYLICHLILHTHQTRIVRSDWTPPIIILLRVQNSQIIGIWWLEWVVYKGALWGLFCGIESKCMHFLARSCVIPNKVGYWRWKTILRCIGRMITDRGRRSRCWNGRCTWMINGVMDCRDTIVFSWITTRKSSGGGVWHCVEIIGWRIAVSLSICLHRGLSKNCQSISIVLLHKKTVKRRIHVETNLGAGVGPNQLYRQVKETLFGDADNIRWYPHALHRPVSLSCCRGRPRNDFWMKYWLNNNSH